MRRVFLDLDGVMADFDGYFETLTGLSPPAYCARYGDDAMWSVINDYGTFFRDLPPMPGALEAWEARLRHFSYRLVILTACPKDDYENVASQKMGWVREHLGDQVFVCPTSGAVSKPRFMQHPGDILIDDFERNIKRWEEAGGVGIHHTGDWAATLAKLDEVLQA